MEIVILSDLKVQEDVQQKIGKLVCCSHEDTEILQLHNRHANGCSSSQNG